MPSPLSKKRLLHPSRIFKLATLGVFALLGLEPFPDRGVTCLRGRERPDFATPDLSQRAVASAKTIKEDLLTRSETPHAQSGTLCVAALLGRLHARDNRGGVIGEG
jgi:hypothetical protein